MGADWQEPEPIRPSLGRFDTIRIFDALSKKFASTAYPHHGPPAARAHCEGRRKAAFAKPGEIGHCAFGARANHAGGAGNVFGAFAESPPPPTPSSTPPTPSTLPYPCPT